MIIEIEDYNGNTLMAFQIQGTNVYQTLNCSLADKDFDDIFGTQDIKIRMQGE